MTTDRTRAVDELLAKQAITEVIYTYCRALDRMDRALASSVWHEDAVATYPGMHEGTGEGFLDWVWPVHAAMERHSHQITNILIEVDVDAGTAVSESYVTVALRTLVGDGRARDIVSRGRYLDRWSVRDGRWAIDHRRFVGDIGQVHDVDLAGDIAVTSAARRDPTDPSYEVFGA
jgi:hypothetical protein